MNMDIHPQGPQAAVQTAFQVTLHRLTQTQARLLSVAEVQGSLNLF